MSFVIAAPEALITAASEVAAIGSAISAANAAAAVPTTRLLAAGADKVSTAISALLVCMRTPIRRPAPKRRRFMTGLSAS
ncbi:hypothetical protein MSHI_32760 [Mycobacterium shinjukuense]|uniref:PE domain-containing protein n=1 Tax=Mycobacterium shinjukuense TaxID=398694 RepID=A0A7I7MTV4_9MYCO|nr:hypothetical protein MSHI_32760 [Mycobacterium shinjukuense]